MTTVAGSPRVRTPIWTRDFLLTCFAAVGTFLGMALLVPVLPLYVVQVGGRQSDIGLVIAAFALTSVSLRPFLGRAIDQRGAKGILAAGIGVCTLAAALYVFVPSIPFLVALRILHGAGMGAATTAAWALVATFAPADRRGEAMGYFGMFASASFATGPLFGAAIVEFGGYPALFGALTAMSALSLGIVVPLREPAKVVAAGPQKTAPLIARSALIPAMVFFCMTTTFAPTAAFLPLRIEQLGLGTAMTGMYFSIQASGIFLSRLAGGQLSDRFGRGIVIVPSLGIIILGMAILAVAETRTMLFLAAAVHGAGIGILQPALLALAVDAAPEHERGAAMATVTSAMDLGFGMMAVPLGLLLEATDFFTTFSAAGGVACAGLVLFIIAARRAGIPFRGFTHPAPA